MSQNGFQEEERVKRPPLLGRIVDAKIKKYGGDEEYKSFLEMANEAKEECMATKLMVHSSFKILGAPTSYRYNHNDSLLLVYSHYAKMDQTFSTTFQLQDFKNNTLSFKELVMFAFDFQLIPKLLSIDDMKLLWDMVTIETIHYTLYTIHYTLYTIHYTLHTTLL